MKIKVTYYRKLPPYILFTPEETRRFSKEDQKKLRQPGGVWLKELGYPIVEDHGTLYYIEEPK